MQAVEARQHEERGAVDARAERQSQVLISVHELVDLQRQEEHAEHNREKLEGNGLPTIVFEQAPVRDSHCYTRA